MGSLGFFRQDLQDRLDYYSPQRHGGRRVFLVFFMGHRPARLALRSIAGRFTQIIFSPRRARRTRRGSIGLLGLFEFIGFVGFVGSVGSVGFVGSVGLVGLN